MDTPDISWADKGFFVPTGTVPAAALVAGRTSLFDGGFSWPVMTLRESALAHNLSQLQAFTEEHGMLFAPHGKTTMAPALWQRQLDAGAWGITLATAAQVVVARHFRSGRILVANEILDPTALRWLAAEQAADPGFDFCCYVDSPEGVDAVAVAARREDVLAQDGTGFGVLVELGHPGGRTGCRTVQAAVGIAERAAAAPGVRVVGVSGYEGGFADTASVSGYLAQVRELANALFDRGLCSADAVVTAGGSAYFDVVAEEFSTGWRTGFTPRIVLRSGAYLTHDHGTYTRKTPFRRIPGDLDGAIEVWAQVLSAGDPGRVIVGMGRRDAPHDSGLPVALRLRRQGDRTSRATTGAIDKLDDHHGYLSTDETLRPGDLVSFGISHPCTAFDKWPLLPVVDDDGVVLDVVRTHF